MHQPWRAITGSKFPTSVCMTRNLHQICAFGYQSAGPSPKAPHPADASKEASRKPRPLPQALASPRYTSVTGVLGKAGRSRPSSCVGSR
jgi:hypothetical protein